MQTTDFKPNDFPRNSQTSRTYRFRVDSRGMINLIMLESAFKTAFLLPALKTRGFWETHRQKWFEEQIQLPQRVLLVTVSSDSCSVGQEHSSNFSVPPFESHSISASLLVLAPYVTRQGAEIPVFTQWPAIQPHSALSLNIHSPWLLLGLLYSDMNFPGVWSCHRPFPVWQVQC